MCVDDDYRRQEILFEPDDLEQPPNAKLSKLWRACNSLMAAHERLDQPDVHSATSHLQLQSLV